jgi:hypothetical protein
MNRIGINYGGRDYAIGNRSVQDVEAEIAAGVESGRPIWLDVAFGEGTPIPCRLLISPGVPLALIDFAGRPDS